MNRPNLRTRGLPERTTIQGVRFDMQPSGNYQLTKGDRVGSWCGPGEPVFVCDGGRYSPTDYAFDVSGAAREFLLVVK